MEKKIIIAGGGTGGHIFPALAIAGALKKIDQKTDIVFIGAKGKMEMDKVPQAGYKIIGIDIAGFNRSSLIKNMGLPWKLVKSFLQVKQIIATFNPDAVIGVGGYSSFPVLRYAQVKGIPTFLHESNSFAGKSNIYLGKRATKIFVASHGMEKFFPESKIIVTGNPVRPAIVNFEFITKKEALDFFGLKNEKTTVLIIGGSLGAKSINEAIDQGLDKLSEKNIQLIWQAGKPYYRKAQDRTTAREDVWVGEFITRMDMAYKAADIIVSRAGAMAIAEISLVKKPVIFVPYPHASEDHQMANAQQLVQGRAALLIKDHEVMEKLVSLILELKKNEKEQNDLKFNIEKYAISNADELIAQEVFNLIGNS